MQALNAIDLAGRTAERQNFVQGDNVTSRESIKPITARELAQLLDVSQSAVSRAFTEGASISPGMRSRILSTAERLGYSPNVIARILSKRSSDIVGLVVSDMQNPFHPALIEKLSRALQQIGQQCLLFNITPGNDIRQQLVAIRQYNVGAVIILVSAEVLSGTELSRATEGRTAILLNRLAPETNLASVSCDNAQGARALADHLYALGHRRAAFVGGRAGSSTNQEREHAFIARLAELGMTLIANIGTGDFSYAAGYQAAKRIANGVSTDAVFFSTDILAAGGMDGLRDAFGVAVPEEMSIVGFDDIEMASWPHYALTTYRYPAQAVVERCISILSEKSGGYGPTSTLHRITGELVVRRSTGRRDLPNSHSPPRATV